MRGRARRGPGGSAACNGMDDAYAGGMDALAVYVLLQSGQAINDPRLDVCGGR